MIGKAMSKAKPTGIAIQRQDALEDFAHRHLGSGHTADIAEGPSLTNCMDGPCCKPDLTDGDDWSCDPALEWSVCAPGHSARI
jgi:hypothetical protein